MNPARYDVVVIGGGPAGLTAALYLGRSRRRTLVLDGGRPRNARAAHAQGVFTRDGTPPLDLLLEARRQLARYADAEFRPIEALSITGHSGRFSMALADGAIVEANRLLLACGVRDELPPIPGLAELWGLRVHGCAYCHGYEERDRPLATLAEGAASAAAVASLMSISSDLLVCTNGSRLPSETRARVEAHGFRIIEAPISAVEGTGDGLVLRFADGQSFERAGLFVKSTPRPASDLPAQLGCRLDAPARLVVDAGWQTSVPGVYAAGDIAVEKRFVAVAAASGAEAAVAINGMLAQESFGGAWAGPLCGRAAIAAN